MNNPSSESPTRRSGRRTWWARLAFTRINIELTIVTKKMEDVREAGASISIVC